MKLTFMGEGEVYRCAKMCIFYIQWLEEKESEAAEDLEVSPDRSK